MVLCKGSCTSIWVPLTLSAGTKPTAAGQLNTTLGTVQRPGGMQVTYKGMPLYTFVQDTSPGMVTGNGVQDQFGGQQFTWHVAAVGAVSSDGTGGTSTSNGYGY